MPARQLKRVDCQAVQGDGSYMVIRPLTFGERGEGLDVNGLMQRIVEWNWVDWDNEPLPLPHDEEAQKRLTDAEVEFILVQFGLTWRGQEEAKN